MSCALLLLLLLLELLLLPLLLELLMVFVLRLWSQTGPKDDKEEHLWRLRVAVVACD